MAEWYEEQLTKYSLITHDANAKLRQYWESSRYTTVLVQFWSGSGTLWHCIALHCTISVQGSTRVKWITQACDFTIKQDAGYLNYPSWYPCACCNHRCQTSVHQLGIKLQSLNRVRDGTRGMCQAGWKFCLNKCKFKKCSWGNSVKKTEYVTIVIVVN